MCAWFIAHVRLFGHQITEHVVIRDISQILLFSIHEINIIGQPAAVAQQHPYRYPGIRKSGKKVLQRII